MNRPRDKKSAEGLLPRMESYVWKDGVTVSYRYHPKEGKPIALGTDKAVAIRKVAEMTGSADDCGTITEMWRLYHETPEWLDLKPGSKEDYKTCWAQLEKTFGRASPSEITAQIVRRYLRRERKGAPVRANREVALLSNLMNVAIDEGLVPGNVCRQVRRNKETPRKKAPEPQTLARFIAWASSKVGQASIIAAMAEFAALSGNRRIEFRELTWPQVDESVIRLMRAKQRGEEPVIEAVSISPAMRALLDRIRPDEPGLRAVFPTSHGSPYQERAFKSAWSRLMHAAMETRHGPPVLLPEQRFHFHDLRSFYVTQHKAAHGALPDLHANPATTAKVYDSTKVVKRRAL